MSKKKKVEEVEVGEVEVKEEVIFEPEGEPEPEVENKKEIVVFNTLEEYGIIRGVKRGKLASFKVGIKDNLESKTLSQWDDLYKNFYNVKEVK